MSKETSDESDEAIARRVVAGDVDAFELLVDRHAPRVRRIVAGGVPRAVVAEISHDVFVAAYLSLASYVATHGFEQWLARIALRKCADYWRARSRAARGMDASEAEPIATAPPGNDDAELCEWALARLRDDDRSVLALLYFEEFSVKECAAMLGWSESNVKVRAHRARARLRELLRRVLPQEDAR